MSQRGARWNLNDPLPAEGTGDSLEAAGFIAASVGELAQIARRHHLETLGFLLDMALLEAEDVIRTRQMQAKN
jgi:hypothetical protein